MLGPDVLRETAMGVLAEAPDPVVRYRLLRDVLQAGADDARLADAWRELASCPQVQALAGEQRADGGWGRFHSRDSSSRQRILTTEHGVNRALALGLDAAHPTVAAAIEYCAGLLAQPQRFPDQPERNDRWATGVQLFTAGTLALLAPRHPALEKARALWLEVLGYAFAGGGYDAEAEAAAQHRLTGASVAGSYLMLSNRYSVALLASAAERVRPRVLAAYLAWLWRRPEGLGYLCEPLTATPPAGKPGRVEHWLASLELLSRYPGWLAAGGTAGKAALDWLWQQRNSQRRWDCAGRASGLSYFPLSASWRKQGAREHDWTTRVLALLTCCAMPSM